MGFIYEKDTPTNKKAQIKIGGIVIFSQVQALKKAGFTVNKTAEILDVDARIVRRHWTNGPKI